MLWIFLFASWLIFNGRVTVEILIFGAGLSTVINIFCCRVLGYSGRLDKIIFRNFGRIIKYMFILIWEIIKANVGVMKFVLKPGAKIKPRLVYFKTDLRSDISKVALANSITITPGTITVLVEGDTYIVHAFDESMSEGLGESCFVEQLKKMEEKTPV